MTEPVSLSDAKAQVNMATDTSQDTFLTSLLAPARATVERISRFFWVAASRSETFGAWSDSSPACGYLWRRGQYIEIYRQPIASIDSITYGPSGSDTDYTRFVPQFGRFPLRIYPAPDTDFPSLSRGDTIIVNYTSGALNSASEEYIIGKRAMLLLIGHWFENRETTITGLRAAAIDVPWAVTELLNDLRPVSAY